MNFKQPKESINPNTRKVLNESFTHIKLDEVNPKYEENDKIINLLNLYTRQKENSLYKKIVNLLLMKEYNISFDDIKYNEDNKNYQYTTKDGKVISFNLISNYIEGDKIINELISKKRLHKCHQRSMLLSHNIKASKVLTGYIIFKNYKILHSVVETKNGESKIIYDWTNNLIMDKQEYISLFNFSILSKVAAENILNDISLIKDSQINLSNKEYLVFRDEIMKDFEKNKQLFEVNNKKKR